MVDIPPLRSLGEIVQWMNEMLDQMFVNGLAANVQRVTEAIWVPLEIGVLIWMLVYGYLIATQKIQQPFGAALRTILKVLFIVGLIETGGLYQTGIANAMISLPDELRQAVIGSSSSGSQVLADFHNSGLETATRVSNRSPGFWESILFTVVSIIIAILYTVVTILALLMMAVARLGMALIVMIGPIFIAFLLFEQTKEFFVRWLQQALYFGLYGTLFSLLFAVIMEIMAYLQGILLSMTEASEVNLLQILAAIIFSVFLCAFALKLPGTIASKVTGGQSVDMPFVGRL